jgi:hypothetical protein
MVDDMGGKICIHGHFYQPSRENPWTGIIEREYSAAPWHDWNERIADECYLPNTAARILDGQGLIQTVSNNYSRISYDFGPTLLTWLERERSLVYDDIVRADTRAQERFSGHGSALAHPYHHLIMPLLSRTDKETEVRWGIRDFEDRFGRYPEGMWLPEMAVDLETLDVLADHGIRFTLLSPLQACRVRKFHDGGWTDTGKGTIDTTVPYLCRLPAGKELSVFFHDAGISSQVAFGDLLLNGDRFSDLLLSACPKGGLVHFATDGETFGHHRLFGEMALGWCLNRIESSHPGTLTIYGEYLAEHAPEGEVEIIERTSWSCPHGIRRWDEGCPCESGRHKGWSHEWRGPLRNAVYMLSHALSEIFGREAGEIFRNPWSARDDSIRIIRDSSPESIERFFRDHAGRSMDPEEREKALALIEMARQCLVMQTSCAWFFDDIADPEAVQILRNAARAVQLARDWTGTMLEPVFMDRLSAIKGNRPEYPDGGTVYRECVIPLVLDQKKEIASLALIDVVSGMPGVCNTDASPMEFLSCGELFSSHDLSISGRPVRYCFLASGTSAALGLSFTPSPPVTRISADLLRTVRKKGYSAGIKRLSSSFPLVFTHADLPPAGKELALRSQFLKISGAFNEAAGDLLDRYTGLPDKDHKPAPFPDCVSRLACFVLHSRVERVFTSPVSTAEDLQDLATAISHWGITLPQRPLHEPSGQFMKRLMEEWASHPEDSGRLTAVKNSLSLLHTINISPPLWYLQNLFIAVRDGSGRFFNLGEHGGDWWKEFQALGRILGVNVDEGQGLPRRGDMT